MVTVKIAVKNIRNTFCIEYKKKLLYPALYYSGAQFDRQT